MSYKSSDVVKLTGKGISGVHDPFQAPTATALGDVLQYLWNYGGPDHSASIEELTDGLNWKTNTFGRMDFTPEFTSLVNKGYVKITSTERPKGWDIKLASGKIVHEDPGVGDYDYMADKYPLAIEIRKND